MLQTQVKEDIKSEYLTRMHSVLKVEISSKNAASAISTLAIPTLRYFLGIIRWKKVELRSLDHKTCKIMVKLGYHHLKSDIN